MLHELSLAQTAWPYPIGKYRIRCVQIYFNLVREFCFDTRDVGLSDSVARPMKLRCCVFSKVFMVNHWHVILKCYS